MSDICQIVFDSTAIVPIFVTYYYKRSLETAQMSRSLRRHAKKSVRHVRLNVANTIMTIAKLVRKHVQNARKHVVSLCKETDSKKNDASFHALSSGETQARFPASFKQESGSYLPLTAHNALFPVGVSCDASFFFYVIRVADHHSATLIFVEDDI